MPTYAEYKPFEASFTSINNLDQAPTTGEVGKGFNLAGEKHPDPIVCNKRFCLGWRNFCRLALDEVHTAAGIVSKFSLGFSFLGGCASNFPFLYVLSLLPCCSFPCPHVGS